VKILAIRFARLGDVVLLTPALSYLKRQFPDAELTLLTGSPCAPVGELCPAVDDVISIDRIAMRDNSPLSALAAMARLVRILRKRVFDLVIDFHSFRETNLLCWLSGAAVRVGMKRFNAPYLGFCFNRPPLPEDKTLHVADMFEKAAQHAAAEYDGSPRPAERGSATNNLNTLWIPEDLEKWAVQAGPAELRLALYIDAPAAPRIWPAERFAQIADFAIEQLGVSVIVLAGANGSALVRRVQNTVRNPHGLSVFTDLSVPQLAALIASCCLLVSNDTGPMHFGPAVGVPTLGLFSVGFPDHFRPIGRTDQYLRENPIENIEVKEVIEAIQRMWTTAGLDSRRLS
jgi:ADP-heptose:LPS heptosyltransferase